MSCVAPNCSGRYKQGVKVGYFRIPSDYKRKQLWLKALGREDWEPKSYHRVCGVHFVKGRPSLESQDVDYIPTLFPKKEESGEQTNDPKFSKTKPPKISNTTGEGAIPMEPKNIKLPFKNEKAQSSKEKRSSPRQMEVIKDAKVLRPRHVSISTQTVSNSHLLEPPKLEVHNHTIFMNRS